MQIVVVSDASPIRALHHLGLIPLCRQLYGSIIVPGAVERELLQATATCPSLSIAGYPEFDVRRQCSRTIDLGVPADLDAGETEAIALALELRADLLLMDERKGTAAARSLGLATIGVFGVLLEAKRKGYIPHVLPHVDRLIAELRFFASPGLRARRAQLAGE